MHRCKEISTRMDLDDSTVTLSLSFKFPVTEFIIDKIPKSCNACPVGYMSNNMKDPDKHVDCGRRIPLDSEIRSPFCKLMTLEEFIKHNI